MTYRPRRVQPGLKTPEQVRKDFAHAGISVSAWAKQNGYERTLVLAVLSGRLKGAYGKAHEVAVALRIKDGRIVSPSSFCAPQREAA